MSRPPRERVLTVEAPGTFGLIDFLQDGARPGVTVEAEIIGNNRVLVRVKVSHGPGSSTWDEHELEASLHPVAVDEEEE